MIMSRWTLCLLGLLGAGANEDAKFQLTGFPGSIKPRINGKYAGCTVSQQWFRLTCGAGTDDIPDKAFRTVVNCRNMAEDFQLVKLRPGPQCGKVVFTQHIPAGAKVSQDQVELLKGEVANITCVVWPFHLGKTGLNADGQGFYELGDPITLEATGTNMRGQESSPEFWEIGGVAWKIADVSKDQMDYNQCYEAAYDAFKWKLSLIKSSQNVHELQWSSQPEEPTSRRSIPSLPDVPLYDALPSKATFCLKDVAFKQIKGQLSSASVIGPMGHVQVDQAVQLQMADAPCDLTGKHEETMKLLVDATQLPKELREKTLTVGIKYQTPGSQYPKTTYLKVPIADPIVPDSQPDEKPKDQPDQPAPDQPAKKADQGGGLGAGFWVILILILMGLGVGGFLYRRNMLIQAHARQPLP